MDRSDKVQLALIEIINGQRAEIKALYQARDDKVITLLNRIDRKENKEMADITVLEADVTALVSSVNAAKAALDDLAQKVADGGSVTQADIDAIDAQLTSAKSTLDTAVSTDDPAPAPPAGS